MLKYCTVARFDFLASLENEFRVKPLYSKLSLQYSFFIDILQEILSQRPQKCAPCGTPILTSDCKVSMCAKPILTYSPSVYICITGLWRDTDDGPTYLIDWYGDYVIDDPMDVQWTGALRHHIREAEASALIWTAFYAMAHHSRARVSIYSDALSVLNAATAKGVWSVHSEEHIGMRLRLALFQILERIKSQELLYCRHVKSHTGVFANELADSFANALRTGALEVRTPPRHYANWMHAEPHPSILHVGGCGPTD